MTAYALISGTLHGAPVTRQTRNGDEYVRFTLRVTNGNAVEWWSVTTFLETARAELEGLDAGDALSCSGPLGVETYTKGGETKIGLRLKADRILPLKATPRAKSTPASKASPSRRTGAEIAASSWASPNRGGDLVREAQLEELSS